MKTIKARYNWGRWIWDCPDCNAANKINPGENMAFCGECYPDKKAKKTTVINGVVLDGIDSKRQEFAKRQAWAEDRVYKIRFPKDYKKIVEALRGRKVEHMSWEVGETVKNLLYENATLSVLDYMRTDEIKETKKEKRKTIELAELDDETLRRIY